MSVVVVDLFNLALELPGNGEAHNLVQCRML
jgi:hypothetical protein